ncbi:MAG: radical SAM protein [Gammaproteobacteria bacterium]|nr:radical SAM protein [Gammaproteobacteria bacterium]
MTRLFLGAESGSPAILEEIEKNITTDDILNGSRTVVKSGIEPVLSFMSGFPGETQEDLEKTVDIILELWSIDPAIIVNGVFPFNAYPGTALYATAIEEGLESPKTLKEWGEYSFQYKPDNPWLDVSAKKRIEILFYMVRFKYYFSRLEDRYKGGFLFILLKALTFPLFSSVKIRMKYKLFGMAYEWRIFAYLFRRTFGYL